MPYLVGEENDLYEFKTAHHPYFKFFLIANATFWLRQVSQDHYHVSTWILMDALTFINIFSLGFYLQQLK